MRPLKFRKPFTLYRKQTKTGPVWYARFWDDTTQRYAVTRSTGVPVEGKRQRRYEAEQAAGAMLPSVCFGHAPDKSFIHYAAEFWTVHSPYIRECETVRKNLTSDLPHRNARTNRPGLLYTGYRRYAHERIHRFIGLG